MPKAQSVPTERAKHLNHVGNWEQEATLLPSQLSYYGKTQMEIIRGVFLDR